MTRSRQLLELLQEVRRRYDVETADVDPSADGFKAWARCWNNKGAIYRIVYASNPEQAATDLLNALRATDMPVTSKSRTPREKASPQSRF